jgi:hypothetical protein
MTGAGAGCNGRLPELTEGDVELEGVGKAMTVPASRVPSQDCTVRDRDDVAKVCASCCAGSGLGGGQWFAGSYMVLGVGVPECLVDVDSRARAFLHVEPRRLARISTTCGCVSTLEDRQPNTFGPPCCT